MSAPKLASTVVVVERKEGGNKNSVSNLRNDEIKQPKERKQNMDPSATKAGGAYIPPAKLRMLQQRIEDKNSEQYQRLSWELLKKRIHGQVNRANVENLTAVVFTLLQENVVRGKGLVARSILQAQAFSPAFSNVYAALVAIINSKFPHIGELVLKRLIIQFKRAFRNNDKAVAITASKFLAHLINQNVAHEVLALELLHLLLESPTDDSVEVAIAFLKECGAKLTQVSPRGIDGIYNRLRSILHESEIDKRVQYAIEVAFHVRKDKFAAYPAIGEKLDLVQEEDQITHMLSLDDEMSPENMLNVFRFDPDFLKNQEMYEEIKKEMLESDSEGEDESEDEEKEDGAEGEGGPSAAPGQEQQTTTVVDNTEINLVAFRRTVYLTIQSSLDYQEAIHKLLKMEIKPGMEVELCHMILDCCAQQRTYEKFYGLMAERFCRLRKEYQGHLEQIFRDTYDSIHRFEITKLRNTTRLFAHLLFTDSISWNVLGHIKLNEEDTTSASRIFIKILFQELAEYMGMEKLYERIQDPTMQMAFDGILPKDNPRDTRFSINFFTSIGLGGLTVDLREHLKSGPKQPETVAFPQAPQQVMVKVKLEEPQEVLKVVKTNARSSSSSSCSETESSSSSDDSRERRRKRKHHKTSTKEDRTSKSKKKRKEDTREHKKTRKDRRR